MYRTVIERYLTVFNVLYLKAIFLQGGIFHENSKRICF